MCSYLGNFTVFHAKLSFWATLLKEMCQISLISPQKSAYFIYFMYLLCAMFDFCHIPA